MGDDRIDIVSTRDPDRDPVCELTWGPLQWYATVPDVRETALDLMTCAAYAEMMMTLITDAGLPPEVVARFTTVLLEGREKRYFGAATTLRMMPAGASKQKQPLVLLKRGSMDGMLKPDEAREMALYWLETAEATESDQLVGEALRAVGISPESVASAFGYLRQLRDQPD
jgi:hypothetical protein